MNLVGHRLWEGQANLREQISIRRGHPPIMHHRVGAIAHTARRPAPHRAIDSLSGCVSALTYATIAWLRHTLSMQNLRG